MNRYFHIEWSRYWHNKRTWIILMIGCAVTVSHYFSFVRPMVKFLYAYQSAPFMTMNPHSWYEKWIGGELVSIQSYLFFLLLPFFCVFSCSATGAEDRQSGYNVQMMTRGSRIAYHISKYIVTFLSGGIAIIVPLMLNLYLSACTLPSIPPDPATGTSMLAGQSMWVGLYFRNPDLYIGIYLILIFVFSGLIAVTGLAIGMLTHSRFAAVAMPTALYVLIHAVFSRNSYLASWSPFSFLTPSQRAEGTTLSIVIAEMSVLFLFSAAICFLQAKTEEGIL